MKRGTFSFYNSIGTFYLAIYSVFVFHTTCYFCNSRMSKLVVMVNA